MENLGILLNFQGQIVIIKISYLIKDNSRLLRVEHAQIIFNFFGVSP